ncbi:branched-chain amino acid aminotransferase [Rhodovulum sp. DZ06]|uniref:branched-chain amino acid aminotransferase n=1 Tax=Rhodovulum sp. DZ06 TaxID=3425126 RepID=UPI003D33039B
MSMSDGRIRTFHNGAWHEGDVPVAGAATHGLWLGTTVFDGARTFEGVSPDLDLHCARLNRSARAMGMAPVHSDGELVEIAQEGIAGFNGGEALYIRPTYWSKDGDAALIGPDPESTDFALCIEEFPMPDEAKFEAGASAAISSFRRPNPSMAMTEAKAACLYPNNARMLREVRAKGFDDAISLDPIGNVAEFGSSNLFIVKDGVAATPIINGTFLNGITRQRVIKLLNANGVECVEAVLSVQDLWEADEIFSTGNARKIGALTRFETRELEVGPVARLAKKLYWEFAHG